MKTLTKFLVCLLVVPFAASLTLHAEDEIPNNEIWYTSTDGNVVTPYATDGFGANIVSNTYTSGKGVIRFDGLVANIGASAFYNCTNLSSITMPDFIWRIEENAFSGCSNLSSITISNSVTTIENNAFDGCYSLPVENNIRYADTYLVAAVDQTLSFYTIRTGTRWIGTSAFRNCSNLLAIAIPNSVTRIGKYAFQNCSSLNLVNFSTTLTHIEYMAFFGCSSLTSITIPNSVTSIGGEAFYDCSGLTSATIGNSVVSIGESAFRGCYSLASITIPNSVKSIGYYAFGGCSSLTAVHIDNIESWCQVVFGDYSSNPTSYSHKLYIDNVEVTEVVIPSTIKTINDYTFYNCSNLSSITIPNSVTSIGSWAFYSCSYLASITIPNSVTSIGASAFNTCSSLTSFTIPNSVTSIGGGAFYHCYNLSSVTNLASSPQTINSNTFYGSSPTIHVYEGLRSAYKAANVWKELPIVDDIPTVKATSITLGSSTYYCNVGGGITPSAIVSDEATIKTVTWTSSDPSVLTILDDKTGQAFGLQEGVTTITATTIDGSALSASATVYVGDYTPVTSVTLDKSTAELMVDESLTLSATVLPDDATKKTVAWTSSNPEVATVSSEGVVSALSIGTTTITATSTDGTALSATCAVTVVTANVSVTDTENVTTHTYVKSNDDMALSDNIKSIVITESIAGVDVTYTRNFSSATAGNWQAWYMPFDVAYDDMSTQYEVAEVYGILMDKAGSVYVAFNKMTEGTVKAHTPYVVKAKTAGEIVVTTTTDLQPTEDAKSFAIQSAYNNFTFGGVYENSYLSASSTAYALNKSGDFAAMASDVYLRPFRIYMRITDREDNPYAAVTTPPAEVKVVVLGEDDTTGLESLTPNPSPEGEESIYNLSGQRINKMQRGINIVNGKKVLY